VTRQLTDGAELIKDEPDKLGSAKYSTVRARTLRANGAGSIEAVSRQYRGSIEAVVTKALLIVLYTLWDHTSLSCH
jgi:hypothetical protein